MSDTDKLDLDAADENELAAFAAEHPAEFKSALESAFASITAEVQAAADTAISKSD